MPTLLYIPRFDESGAGPRYRVYQYFDSFKKLGIEITAKPLLTIEYLNNLYFKKKRSLFYLIKAYLRRAIFLLRNKNKFDMVLMDGELFPFLPYFLEKMFLPRRYIIDQDDAIFHTYDDHRFFLVRFLFSKKIGRIWEKSQHLIVGNSYTKKHALALGAKIVTALPTAVDANKYTPQPIKKNSTDEIIIGWVGSPPTVWTLSLIKTALINVSKKAKIILHIIGAHYEIEGVNIISNNWPNGWVEKQEIEMINKIDIGIMPLRNGSYEKGKCGFKLIKYMACAKPMIASAVGMNLEIVDHGKNGYLASTVEEWEYYLLDLISNSNKREEFGRCGREKMVKEYSLQATAPILGNILMEAYR